ncbi:hypothetical protein P153DRAFT_41162 [Dothidotthia symphoricarpi CBS 119687]|uniref:Uncharacterized protein n=1 Tax=Dothidotthia symphoricarpi CBS 119687 TaxID=1392245 RepID=A0A6A6ABL6_9PLEO|nr:uncharacterized protein P153DRAFT_41162 [Dothidotthia symphoricarpi CBS 119687]KAF2128603.1 hypothetical protein P153DRAFT_41162 [Dothidotthia symphoricarpi CBS 119687]
MFLLVQIRGHGLMIPLSLQNHSIRSRFRLLYSILFKFSVVCSLSGVIVATKRSSGPSRHNSLSTTIAANIAEYIPRRRRRRHNRLSSLNFQIDRSVLWHESCVGPLSRAKLHVSWFYMPSLGWWRRPGWMRAGRCWFLSKGQGVSLGRCSLRILQGTKGALE